MNSNTKNIISNKAILLISPSFAPYRAIRATSLANYLIQRGDSITVVRNLFMDTDRHPRIMHEPSGLHYVDVHSEREMSFSIMERIHYAAVKDLLEKQRFDIAIISLGPFYTYACIELLKEKGIPVILDFRDLCVYEGLRKRNPVYLAVRIRRWSKLHKLELAAIRYASRVVTVVEDDRRLLSFWYKKQIADSKIVTIFNGYDETALDGNVSTPSELPCVDREASFYIGVFGKLAYYNKKSARNLFESISRVEAKKVYVVRVGEKENLDTIIKASGMEAGRYIYCGEMNYADGMGLMASMDAFCIVGPSHKGALGTKLFDYIYLNKPILVLEKIDTAITKLILSPDFSKGGFVCRSIGDTVNAINTIILSGIDKLTTENNIGRFSRSKQNKKYCELIDNVLETGPND